MLWFKAIAVLVLIAFAEVLHGILRVRLLNRRVGDRRARQIGVATGSLIILAIAWLTVPWIGVASASQALAVGGLWLVGMLAVDVGFGRYVFHFPWSRILREFDPRQGGFLGFGMLVLLAAPLAVAWLRGLW